MEQALLFFDFSKNIEQDVDHNGEQNELEARHEWIYIEYIGYVEQIFQSYNHHWKYHQ